MVGFIFTEILDFIFRSLSILKEVFYGLQNKNWMKTSMKALSSGIPKYFILSQD